MNWITCPHCKIPFDADHPANRGEYEEPDTWRSPCEAHATSIICPECDEYVEVTP